MILQCDQCSARFRLDDSKIKDGGIKVRCSKCKNVFFVSKDVPQDEPDFDSILSGLGSSVQEPQSPPFPPSFPSEDEGAGLPGFEGEMPSAVVAASPAPASEESEFAFDEFVFDQEPTLAQATPDEAARPLPVEDDLASVDFSAVHAEPQVQDPRMTSTDTDEEFSFDAGLDSTDEGWGADFPADDVLNSTSSESPEKTEDDLFTAPGQVPFSMEPEEPSSTPDATDLESLPVSSQEELKLDETESVDFGTFDFDERDATQPVKEEVVAVAPGSLEKPASTIPFSRETVSFAGASETVVPPDELPPLSIASRRRGFSLFPVATILIAVLLVLAISGAGIYFLKKGPLIFNQMGLGFMAKWFGIEAVEEGKITINNPVAAFYRNSVAGELFVVSGEAMNNYKKPRASIHVKAALFDSKGAVLLSKGAYCGNSLSKDQLATLPLAKIEEVMNNQFGDSLANLSVKPGKGIPFIVVFANVPKEAVDFAVEITGSTVAGQ